MPTVLEYLRSLIKFGLVGLVGVFVNLLVFQTVQTVSPLLLASASGFLAGALNNYALHRRWTFERSGRLWRSFLVVSVILALNAAVVHGFHYGLGIYPLAAQALGIACTWPLNWLAHRGWVFRTLDMGLEPGSLDTPLDGRAPAEPVRV